MRSLAPARSIACLALAVGGVGVAAGPALAAPAVHFEQSAVGDVFTCGDESYTVFSGTKVFTLHAGESRSGNSNFIAVIRADDVRLADEDGGVYRLRGIVQDGERSNTRGDADTFVVHLAIVSQTGGVVGRVSITAHSSSATGRTFFLDNGTCVLP